MENIYGPVPSRRLGLSLGVSPIPKKYCNYSCVYCQLGRTDHMTNKRELFFKVESIMAEFDEFLKGGAAFDVVTIVGEGEPTLYKDLGALVDGIHERTDKPVAVITNGALLYDPAVRAELSRADIVLPSLDAYDEASYKMIDRPHGSIGFDKYFAGLKLFSEQYQGQIWIEIMLVKGMNDDDASLAKFAALLKRVRHDRLYLNTPMRPPAESGVQAADSKTMQHAVAVLGGISIDLLASYGFYSGIADHYEAILSIIRRHPMNQHEIEGFLQARDCHDEKDILARLEKDDRVTMIEYKGYRTFRLK